MSDPVPIAAWIEARARDLYGALADAVEGKPHWRPRALRLLADIEASAVLSIDIAIAEHKATSAIAPPPYVSCHQPTTCAGLGYCPHVPSCNAQAA